MSRNSSYHKAIRQRRLVLGLCTRCGEQPAKKGRKQCVPCLEFDRARAGLRRQEGTCSRCKKRETEPGKLCKRCHKIVKDQGTTRLRVQRDVAKAAEHFVEISDYLATAGLSSVEIEEIRQKQKEALRDVVDAVHALQGTRKRKPVRARQVAWRKLGPRAEAAA